VEVCDERVHRSVEVEYNNFVNNDFGATSSQACLMDFSACGLRSIRGNTASGNTVSSFHISPGFSHYSPTARPYLQSSEDLPFIILQLVVDDSTTLEIGSGSVMKMMPRSTTTSFEVAGNLIATNSVFTSYQDDSHGGDTDLESPGTSIDCWGHNGCIQVANTGSLTLTGCTLQYAQGGPRIAGSTEIDSCLFQYNCGSGVSCSGIGIQTHRISNSVFRLNSGSGAAFSNANAIRQSFTIENCTLSQNGARGLVINTWDNSNASVSVDRCQIAANDDQGIHVAVGRGLTDLTVTNCHIAANGDNGIDSENYGGDEANIRIEGCAVVGNAGIGVYMKVGNPWLVNNTVAHNASSGMIVDPHDEARSGTVNNVLCWNGKYGYSQQNSRLPYFGYNCLWENDGPTELYFRTPDGDLHTIEEIQALGGDYVTNFSQDPTFAAIVIGEVDTILYDDTTDISTLVCQNSVFANKNLTALIVQPDTSEATWFFVKRHSDDSLVVLGDITTAANPGDTFRVFDYHLLSGSDLVEAGNSNKVTTIMDIDGEDRVVDGDDDWLALVDIGADEYDPNGGYESPIKVMSPGTGDIAITNTVCEIRWRSESVDSVNIYYLVDFDPALPRVWEIIDVLVPADTEKIDWIVPRDLLSPRCKIRIEDAGDPGVYDETGLFRIKGYELTRYAADRSYERFSVLRDGWQFDDDSATMWPDTTWQAIDYEGIDPFTGIDYPVYFASPLVCDAKPADFPSWSLFVDAFGVSSCYYDTPQGLFYRPSVVLRWANVKRTWQGSCFGMANASLLAFVDNSYFAGLPGIGPFDSLSSLAITADRRNLCNKFYVYQLDRRFKQRNSIARTLTAKQTLAECKAMFAQDSASGDCRVLNFRDTSTVQNQGGHTVTPYRCEQDTVDGALWRIFVYENAIPMDTTQFFLVDTLADSWEYASLNWSGKDRFGLSEGIGNFYSNAIRKRATGAPASSGESAVLVEVFVRGVDTIGVESSLGMIGREGDSSYNTVAEGFPIVPFDNDPTITPLGYYLPNAAWSIRASGLLDSVFRLTICTDSSAIQYWRSGAQSTDAEVLHYPGDDSSIWVCNSSGAERMFGVKTIVTTPEAELVSEIINVGGSAGDSCLFRLSPDSGLMIGNFGDATTYDVRLTSVGSAGMAEFGGTGVSLPSNTAHLILPDWTNLQDDSLKILIDYGNDGTADDSMFVRNDIVTGVDEEHGSVLPYRFELAQNYPNPFNPVTNIEYSLPRRSHVTIDVFNVLGQRVRSLIDREESAGSYTITWDGISSAGSPVATGVYLYRFQAGDHVETKKMLLLK